jgi:Rrf2 family transcriptional regulator, nitric oxide-sensitive transcriptional repressor
MQLTLFTDYSLRSLVYLGANPDRLCTISEIAKAYEISGHHLRKIVNHLSTVGYIETVRGKGGGLRLSRAPHMINIGAVVRDTEDSFNIVECFSKEQQSCPLLPACALRSVLVDAQRSFMATLDRSTLQDIVGHWVSSRFPVAPDTKNSVKSIARKRAVP